MSSKRCGQGFISLSFVSKLNQLQPLVFSLLGFLCFISQERVGSTALWYQVLVRGSFDSKSLCDKLIRVLGIFRTGPIRGPRATYFTGKCGMVFILLRK